MQTLLTVGTDFKRSDSYELPLANRGSYLPRSFLGVSGTSCPTPHNNFRRGRPLQWSLRPTFLMHRIPLANALSVLDSSIRGVYKTIGKVAALNLHQLAYTTTNRLNNNVKSCAWGQERPLAADLGSYGRGIVFDVLVSQQSPCCKRTITPYRLG